MFGFIKDKVSKIYNQFTSKAVSLFSRKNLDNEFIKDLESLLLSADTGVKTTKKIIAKLQDDIGSKKIIDGEQAREELEKLLISELNSYKSKQLKPKVLLLVGINGSGKTSFIGKFANELKNSGTTLVPKSVLLVAGDTFRAAAVEQLKSWGDKIGVQTFVGKPNQDPASVIFDACKFFVEQDLDHIIIDTAGRLQTKTNLMKELEKIRKVACKVLPQEDINCWLTIDSMLGQNSLRQAEVFSQATKNDGIVLTKLDGTGKGGIVFSITNELKLPIVYVTFGESLEDIKTFDPQEYVKGLMEK